MSKTRRNNRRKHKAIRRLNGDEKHCPNALREILNNLRETANAGQIMSHELYLDRLNSCWRGPRYGKNKITSAIFQRSEGGNHGMDYPTLEAYAREAGVPTSLILLISRVRSELVSQNSRERANGVVVGLRAALDHLDLELKAKHHPDALDVRAVCNAYKAAGGPAAEDLDA